MIKVALLLLICTLQVFSQSVRFSTAWFGPNALPVPEFSNGRIPSGIEISVATDYYYGSGDKTTNGFVRLEIPLLAEKISYKTWGSFLEFYTVSSEVNAIRGMPVGKMSGSVMGGDFYVQTRIRLTEESKLIPDMVFNTTLKTASSKPEHFTHRRTFDTPGYYFDIEIGKSVALGNALLREMRFVTDLGFLCWETTGSNQNDAPLYGAKVLLTGKMLELEGFLSGYWGWMHTNSKYGFDYGDAPIVWAVKTSYISKASDIFLQFQNGIRDYPYKQFRTGLVIKLPRKSPGE